MRIPALRRAAAALRIPAPARAPAILRALAPVLALGALLAPAPAAAQEPQARPTCATMEHRQVDFWVGRWRVESSGGEFLGTNRIVRRFGGCVLQEHWEGAGGGMGESYNLYDRATGQWHQRWVSSTGSLLELDGGLRADGAMVMEGQTTAPGGVTTLHRITWSRVDGDADRVRQHWQSSSDGGATWSDVFEGIYIREH
ncbi:MAG TPA: hypothetical protein VMK65_01240 [Longimicrobiales bacterium]|nr:hypothetical protein [Longimicrobiales bacterium]